MDNMSNEEMKQEAVNYWCYLWVAFFAVFFLLITGKVPNDLFWLAIGFEALCLMACAGAFLGFSRIRDEEEREQHILITSDHVRKIEQERVLKAEEARLKARDDEKKAQRAQLAKLLDEL